MALGEYGDPLPSRIRRSHTKVAASTHFTSVSPFSSHLEGNNDPPHIESHCRDCCCMTTTDSAQLAPAIDVPGPSPFSPIPNIEGNVFIGGESPEDRARRERKRHLKTLNTKVWAGETGDTLPANLLNGRSVSACAVPRFEFEEKYGVYQTFTHEFEWR